MDNVEKQLSDMRTDIAIIKERLRHMPTSFGIIVAIFGSMAAIATITIAIIKIFGLF